MAITAQAQPCRHPTDERVGTALASVRAEVRFLGEESSATSMRNLRHQHDHPGGDHPGRDKLDCLRLSAVRTGHPTAVEYVTSHNTYYTPRHGTGEGTVRTQCDADLCSTCCTDSCTCHCYRSSRSLVVSRIELCIAPTTGCCQISHKSPRTQY